MLGRQGMPPVGRMLALLWERRLPEHRDRVGGLMLRGKLQVQQLEGMLGWDTSTWQVTAGICRLLGTPLDTLETAASPAEFLPDARQREATGHAQETAR